MLEANSKFRIRSASCPIAVPFTFLLVAIVFAQAPQRVEVPLDGKLESWQDNIVRITSKEGAPLFGVINPQVTRISFSGFMPREALKSGMFVRFQAAATADGNFLAPINVIEVFAPDPATLSRRMSPADASRNQPGFYPVAQIEPPNATGIMSPDARVVGQVMNFDQKLLLLQCGERPLKLEVTDNLRIAFTIPSLEFAKQGDTVNGRGILNHDSGQLVIQSLAIHNPTPIEVSTKALESAAAPKTKAPAKSNPKAEAKIAAKNAAIEAAKAKREAKLKAKAAKSKKGSKMADREDSEELKSESTNNEEKESTENSGEPSSESKDSTMSKGAADTSDALPANKKSSG